MDPTNYQLSSGKKPNKPFIAFLIVAIVLFIGASVLGYLYYKKNLDYKNLLIEKQKLEEEQGKTTADLEKENKELTAEKTKLEKQIISLQAQTGSQKTKISAYTDTLNYVADLIQIHNGFDGWTDAEFQTGKTKAVKTGDQSFVDLIDWAWNHQEVSQTVRMTKFLQGVASGINTVIK